MSVAPDQDEGISAIPVHVVKAYTHELFKCTKHLKKHVGFLCLGKGSIKDVEKSVKRINDQMSRSASSAKISGDFLVLTDGSQQTLFGHGENLCKEWIEMRDGLSDAARAAKWPVKKEHKPIPDGINKKATERIEKRRAFKKARRERYTIVEIGEMYAAFLRDFLRVLAADQLSVTAPTFKEFVTLKEVPAGIKLLSARFLLELTLSKDLYVQRFVANNTALFCLAGENVEAIGTEGMDKLISIAWVPDDEVQISCVMAAYMVAKYEPFHNQPAYHSAMEVLNELKDSDGSSAVKAAAVAALAAAKGADAARDVAEAAEKAGDMAKGAFNAAKGLFGK